MNQQVKLIRDPIPISYGDPVGYTQAELEGKAEDFMRDNHPQEFRKMTKAGELKGYLTSKANAARRQAENLILAGVWDQEAWNRAIRSAILESESD